jgi:hypothetical protein
MSTFQAPFPAPTIQNGKYAGCRAAELDLEDLRQAYSSARLNSNDRRLCGRVLARRKAQQNRKIL